MKFSMFYSSVTGNTTKLAEAVKEALAGATEVNSPAEADLVCVGFWTHQGTADKTVQAYLKTLRNAKVFLFGTAGFGDSKTYFDGILENVADSLNDTNDVVGSFMCQGSMPESFRDQYRKMKDVIPNQGPHYDLMITNFDKALSHPDAEEVASIKEAVKKAAEGLG